MEMSRVAAAMHRELRPTLLYLSSRCRYTPLRLQRHNAIVALFQHHHARCFGSKPSPFKPGHKIQVFEQTISSSIANHAASDDEPEKQIDLLRKVRGRVVYQPKDVGWEVVKPLNDANKDISSSSSSIPISLQVKDFADIRNIPFIHHFLPANYPHSVCPSYATYASYCFLGSVAGSSAMVLSTQALLVAVGVGTQSAAPMAAALNWVMKDGVGQLGGVLFASQLGKGGMDVDYWKNKIRKWSGPLYKSSIKKRGNFQRGTADSNPKRWRMVAALALDLSTLLEIFTPFFGPEYFLPCASIANIGKNIGFLAASASRAAIHQSLTKTEGKTSNLGDVTAKAGSQAIVASLLGTGIGILLSQTFCADHGTSGILAGFVVLSAVHQICTYKAIKAVPLKTLDRHRLHIVLDSYMNANLDRIVGKGEGVNEQNESWKPPLTPMEVAERESFLPLMPPDKSVKWLSVGASLVDICPSGVNELEGLMIENVDGNNVEYEKYIIKVLPSSANSDQGAVQLTFFEGANDDDLLQGMFHAYAAHECMSREDMFVGDTSNIVNHSYSVTKSQMPQFKEHLGLKGWQTETGFVNVECGSSCRLKIQEIQE